LNKENVLKIGTRDSQLATWQAQFVSERLKENHNPAELVFVKTEGDLTLNIPLTEMGGKGVFTKSLDEALLDGRVDLAVHSFKDIPTILPAGLKVAAVLKREDPRDVIVTRKGTDFLHDSEYEAVVATSSNRRKSQWLSRYPKHRITDIRGNVNTRLRKVRENEWDAAIFAAAGLKRINLDDKIDQYLEWMIPAPAQGAMAVMIREDNERLQKVLSKLDHRETRICTTIERDFLYMMEAGCSAPVAAYARIVDGMVQLKASVLMIDGSERYDIEDAIVVENSEGMGVQAASEVLKRGADRIIKLLSKKKAL
jgi:hydroxymethylbilane synthase